MYRPFGCGLLWYPEIAYKGSGVQGVPRIWMRGTSRSMWRTAGAMRASPTPIPTSGNIGTSLPWALVPRAYMDGVVQPVILEKRIQK